MKPPGQQGPGVRGTSDPGHDIGALADEIVRSSAEIQAMEAELARLRARYDALSKEGDAVGDRTGPG